MIGGFPSSDAVQAQHLNQSQTRNACLNIGNFDCRKVINMTKYAVSITTGLMASAASAVSMMESFKSIDNCSREYYDTTESPEICSPPNFPAIAAGTALGLAAPFFSVGIATNALLDALDKCLSDRFCRQVPQLEQQSSIESPDEDVVLMGPLANPCEQQISE